MKMKKASKKWHRKALMIDPRKTMLILESMDVKPEYVPLNVPNESVQTEQASPLTPEKPDTTNQTLFLSRAQDKERLPCAQLDEWSRFRC